MYYKSRTRYEVVEAETGQDFQSRLNSTLDRLDAEGKTYTVDLLPGFVAYITVKEERRVAETLAEEYELRGDRHYCKDCPMFSKADDKRVKRGICGLTGKNVWIDSYACDHYYKTAEGGMNDAEEH